MDHEDATRRTLRRTTDPRVSAALHLAGQINRLSQLLGRPFQQRFAAEYDISLTEWRVLVQVVKSPGITGSEVSAATGLTAMAVSRAVQELRADDRLSARADPGDSRRNLLDATADGVAIYEELAPHAVRDVNEIMSALTEDELDLFASLVERINAQTERVLG